MQIDITFQPPRIVLDSVCVLSDKLFHIHHGADTEFVQAGRQRGAWIDFRRRPERRTANSRHARLKGRQTTNSVPLDPGEDGRDYAR